ncbi:hypothetical protein Z043_119723 [Scleropages formosus]|uniref:Uncharacterized protein n=1 Tax=Scleropages formosus TaxID=113540 RepID=A0A0P7Y8U1_SCLFO|nr:hypothetical protein Z043_119723 [Scleropages formosus]
MCPSAETPDSSFLRCRASAKKETLVDCILCVPRWYKLHSKSGKREKERGELQVTIQFTRNNLTASMYDLSVKDKPRSTLGKLKDRVKGKKRGDAESTSAIVPRGYAALSGSGRFCDEGGGDEDVDDEEGGVARRSKVKSFFLKGKLRKTLDTRSSTSLASDGSVPSSPGGSLSPTAGISMVVSDLSNSPSNSSNLTADSSPGEKRSAAEVLCQRSCRSQWRNMVHSSPVVRSLDF